MSAVHFSVSQVRVAATCPRILYFDHEITRRKRLPRPQVTRIWKTGAGDETTACGSLFHDAVERFNRQAAADAEVRRSLDRASTSAEAAHFLVNHVYDRCLDRPALQAKTGEQQAALMRTLYRYLAEVADVLVYARSLGRPLPDLLEEMFGDSRRRVSATFAVGPAGEKVHVGGILDYVFYDWRTDHRRIIDYKLTPAVNIGNDLFQVCVYALMHELQYQTAPDVGVLYLHPERHMEALTWEQVHADRPRVYDLLASMREWVRYDEKTGAGLKPPGEPSQCAVCKWKDVCVPRLGPKEEGQRLSHWTAPTDGLLLAEPPVEVHEPEPYSTEEATEDEPGTELDARDAIVSEPVDAGRLWLGRTVSGDRPVELPLSVLCTHTTVVGAAGSGKTWLAKVLAEEAILQGVPVLAIDPQGDLVQFVRRCDRSSLSEAELARFDRFAALVEPRVLTPGSSQGIRVCLSPIRLFHERELVGVADEQRRAECLEMMLGVVAGNLVSLARAGGEVDSQQTFLLHVLRRLTRQGHPTALQLAEVVHAINNPEEVRLEDPDEIIKKSERQKLGRKLNNLVHGPAAALFTGGRALDMDWLLRPDTPGRVPLNILYLNSLPDNDQKRSFVATLVSEIYRWMITAGSSDGRPRLLVYLDEARDFVPAGASKPSSKEPLIRLFAQGRKYGVAGLVCTQSARSVDYNIFANCSTKIIGRLESTQDRTRVEEWFAHQGPTPDWLPSRTAAEAGTFVGRWPGMPPELDGQVFRSRPLYSLHEGAWSPDRVEQELHSPGSSDPG